MGLQCCLATLAWGFVCCIATHYCTLHTDVVCSSVLQCSTLVCCNVFQPLFFCRALVQQSPPSCQEGVCAAVAIRFTVATQSRQFGKFPVMLFTNVCLWEEKTKQDVACCSVLQYGIVCCSVLQCVAMCCSVLQCAAVCWRRDKMLRVAVCCSMLQYVAVCCSVLQCVAVCWKRNKMLRVWKRLTLTHYKM